MSHPRLLLFLSDVEGNLTALRQTLKRVCAEVEATMPEVAWAEAPGPLADAGWHVAEVRPAQGSKPRGTSLEAHLEAVTAALSQDFRDMALGLYADRAMSYARASVSGPGQPPRVREGEYPEVMRQVARWLAVEPVSLARLLGEPAKNVLAAEADFGSDLAKAAGAPRPPGAPGDDEPLLPPEPDDDDRFVEAKLAQAKALMEQYRSSRK
ncbi:hypothetical protein FGE12_22060 [Aggregicoccus sp. 17bor-14]|uniref:hypothetical protein n=1 Tax=Myxococcaceae TaxID=31 RepID=UPI00129D01EE|nr:MULTISPECIES: hypothetical protein [Myxococcaceae]MBF5045103.1 hypothetical protein [Simulacricoccus sp. 17bor-14]MRI90845.1 hypothetical protein [Aggregicoccus sp. 17bor-14]